MSTTFYESVFYFVGNCTDFQKRIGNYPIISINVFSLSHAMFYSQHHDRHPFQT